MFETRFSIKLCENIGTNDVDKITFFISLIKDRSYFSKYKI